jgi:C-methyltransferase C-terminal domain/Methyltransferase domain/Putative zinc binding domain
MNPNPAAIGTGSSVRVDRCQLCGSRRLDSLLFLGYLPPVNTMETIGTRPKEERFYPAELLRCAECELVQLGLIVDAAILFPPHYAYTSSTTRILRENFAELHAESCSLFPFPEGELIVDIGSNDGTLLANWKDSGHRVCGIEPTNVYQLAVEKGIPTINAFFSSKSAAEAVRLHGRASRVTATNVFAHIEDVDAVVGSILDLLEQDGIFISESHYLLSLVETLQYDTIYHEHLRYYSATSLQNLLRRHGLQIIHVKKIPTHGGSIRVYAARKGKRKADSSVEAALAEEQRLLTPSAFADFRRRVSQSKLSLAGLLSKVCAENGRVYGIGAPSRASTLINHVALDETAIECVLEIKGSYKIGKYMPGTLIPVADEEKLFSDPPEYALLFSWHIAQELIPKLRKRGYDGKFIVPLPEPRIVD